MSAVSKQCPKCKSSFVFTSLEVRAYAAKGWDQPVLCRKCLRETQTQASTESQVQPLIVNSARAGR